MNLTEEERRYNLQLVEDYNKKQNKKKKKSKTSGILKKSSAFDDGYDFGDVTKSTVSTIADLGTNVVKGIFNFGENIGDAIQYGAAGVSDFVGADKLADQIRENAKMDVTSYWFNPVQEKIDKNSILGDTTDNLATGVGNVIGMAGTGGVLGKASNVKMGAFSMPTTSIVSGLGSGMTEAYNNGATDGEAFVYGLGSGLAEGFSESLFSGLGNKFTKVFGPGALDDAVINKLTSKITNQTLKTLTQSGLKAAGEGVEEVVSGFLGAAVKNLTYLDDKDFFEIVKDENLFDQFVQGTVLSAIMQTPGTVNAVAKGQDYVVPEQIENNVQNNQELVENLPQNGEVNTNTLPAQKNTKNSAKFEFMETSNPKINRFNNSAAMYYENNKKNRDMFNSMRKIINDKGYNVLFDDSIVNQNGNSVNAQIRTLENGEVEIRINPNSERAGEFLLMHEVTHAIETNSMKNLILDFASKNQEFNQALESLKQTYGTNDVSSEVVADISGQLLGNQEFINSLSLEQPSLFKQIYNKIIELANKLTGNSNQALFMKDLKNKWEAAYKNSTNQDAVNNLNSETNNQKINFTGQSNESFESQVEMWKQGKFDTKKHFVVLKETPKIYQDLGLKNHPILLAPGKLERIYNKNGRQKGEYHNLGDLIKELPRALENPLNIVESTSDSNSIVVITDLADNNENIVVVSLKINGSGAIEIDNMRKTQISNVMTSAYGRKNYDYQLKPYNESYDGWMKLNKDNDRILYDIDEGIKKQRTLGQRLQLPITGSLTDVNIPQSNENVKSDIPSINNSIQKVQKNTKNSENDITWQEHLEKNYKSTGTRTDLDTMEKVETKQDNKQELNDSSFFEETAKRYEDLQKTSYIEYFRKDNGDVRVNMMDTNNNLVNQLDLWSNTEAIKQFGEKLGNQLYETASDNNNKIEIGNDINNLGNVDDYFMNHRPTETGLTADDLTNENTESPMPKDIYEHPEYYFQMKEKYSKESMDVVRKIKGNPDAEITIYRATPGNSINPGDWVTLSKSYAEQHNESQFDGKANILEMKVKAKDVQFAGDDINEFGYFPKYDNIKYSLSEASTKDKTLNPLEISKLTKEDANTTPTLSSKKRNKQGDGNSKFFENILFRTDMLTDKSKITILSDEDVKFYDKVTNKSSLEKAMNRLEQDGRSEVDKWFNKKSEDASDVDVAEGWILLKQYQDKIAKTDNLIEKEEMNRSMVEVAKKMREIGTKSGQAVQAFNIMNRLTPEGMVYYAQSELDEAFEKMSKYKTKKWIDANKEKFALTSEETEFIMNTMQEVVKMKDGYDKRVKLAEIQKVMTDKIPPEAGEGMKAWMRISMLFNPKTQVRNVLGNAIVTPVNAVSDFFASKIDKVVSKKTGVRTTGTLNLKNYGKGVKEGLYQSYNDFKKGINTRNIEGNRFEISQGKSFNDNSKIGKRLNQVDSMLSFLLDAGDRGFYEGAFVNSLNNQMILNNVTEPTQDMIDIATQEALSRTWQDNNNYTKFVMQTRNGLNMIHLPGKKGYGLGDVLIPFAKTPANLTKAIVDYSPVGLVNALVEGKKLKNVLSNGQYDAKLQHKFVQDLGKAVAGTMLYVIGYALANAGVISGESDEDKDTRNFMKNALGTNSYSIKIGNKSFTYDWAQPIAAPLSIMANYTQKKKQNADASKLENLISSLDVAGNILLEQSFLESINTVLSNDDGVATGIQEAMLELPSRAVPTFFKQITDLVDGTQRQTFEYDKPLKTAVNKVMAKVPGLSNTLSASVDTMGREIQKYGGKNNLFNVFVNPANVSSENISKSGQEIYRIYKETGDKTVMPRTVDYYINNKGEKIVLTNKQREEYQKISGQIIEENIEKLLNDSNYQKLSDKEKAEVISNIVNYSYNKAKQDILGIEMADKYNKVNEWLSQGKELYSYYSNKKANDYYLESPEKYAAITSVVDFKDYSKYLKEVNEIKEKYQGEQYSQYRKQAILKYVNQLPYSKVEKIILYKLLGGYSIKDYQPVVYNYIGKLNISKQEKLAIINALYGTDYEY